eukprot:TRINITY_DN2637_c0_g1_i3.p1 TRINITY_DN2637_c0_g1~~TRINITY_DN2637_c0_g1_i3.p1  ORF type:complete len:337 (+),score=112.60 TRINITY_DN2637_c0_g1_i3:389-1399(+)
MHLLPHNVVCKPQISAPPPGNAGGDSGAMIGEKPFEDGESISSHVNQEMVAILLSMGYSKNVAEKALFFVQSASVEKAQEWIDQNKNEPDFEEELRIVKQADDAPKLTPEEAAQKARELQQLLRQKRLEREKEEELERERSRIKGGKELTEARRAMEEQQKKRDAEFRAKEKREDELAKQRMLEQLERDREERFGKKAVKTAVHAAKPPKEQCDFIIKQMKTVYPVTMYPQQLKTCFTTIKIYLENILKNPGEEKFKKINLSNENFKKRIGDWIGGTNLLTAAGFQEENGFLLMHEINTNHINDVISVMDREITNINQIPILISTENGLNLSLIHI